MKYVLVKTCKQCQLPFEKKYKLSYSQFEKQIYCSTACQGKGFVGFKMPRQIVERLAREKTGKSAYWKIGEKNFFWRGGKTPFILAERQSLRYKNWRRAIFERDDWTCQECKRRGGKLNADHLKSFTHFPELRYDLSNGRTLCVPCHIKTPTFGGGSRS